MSGTGGIASAPSDCVCKRRGEGSLKRAALPNVLCMFFAAFEQHKTEKGDRLHF
uniref:Uncharacterized protein n=1 Tax=Geobacter sp. (strain M21) TaxID=443144 RepID=C6E0W0_GEOSM